MKFVKKLLGITFKDISDRPWISSLLWYMIDSKERTRKRLDLFLKDQIDNPHPDLVEVAKRFSKYKNPDRMIVEILKYVYGRVKYKYDINNFGKLEYWADAHLTWITKFDDCDGINALIYVLMRLTSSQIINNYLFCVIGKAKLRNVIDDPTSKLNHFWLLYFSPKTGKWHSIDGTYYPDLKEISRRPLFKLDEDRYISTWFLFNESYSLKQK
ncbi:hypothetical protein LCGC14_1703340 [marine sediment metagenome]|uniref:Transglutaminase-like domain-containing protein n=1 Tax=marine sediment metagenome TaxID=412755 RepID=A0A0F9HH11_9ZZZZ